jgi:Xaa-Pro aminopeptidase
MDVHDVGMYTVNGQARPLAPGMVITIEPGLYIARDAQRVADKWRGIGVRIEDDILVTETGCVNLTAGCPKEISELEAICRPGY